MTFRDAAITLIAAAALGVSANAGPVKKHAVALPARADWLSVVVATPAGGFRQGNPAAKVKLLEFGSLTCPHCAAFAREHVPILRAKYVATGKVSYEYRPFLLNGVDFAPSLLVECQSPPAALALIEAFYATQATWTAPFTKPVPDDVQKKFSALPQQAQIAAFAQYGGLDKVMRTRGMAPAQFTACLSDAKGIAKLNAVRDDANKNYGLTAVPTFVINGKTVVDVYDWAALQPKLDAALAL